MRTTLIRSYELPGIELRGGDGRTLVGLAAPFNKPATIYEGGERFAESIAPGAFRRTIEQRASKIPLLALHDSRRLPVGPVQRMEETGHGLEIEARVSKTRDGD